MSERRVFEGVAREDSFGHRLDTLDEVEIASKATDWFRGLYGRRVRVTVEVLEDVNANTAH